MTRGSKAGVNMAKAIIEFIHLMYQRKTAKRVLNSLIRELNKHKKDFE